MRTMKQDEEISNLHEIAAVQLKNKDLIKLSAKAKEKSMLLLEEQGISAIALALSRTLVDFVQHPEKIKAWLSACVSGYFGTCSDCFGRKLEPERYKSVKALFDKINSQEITGVVSFYSLHELFIFAIENFSQDISRSIGKKALEEILKNRVEIIPLLNREQRIRYSSSIKLNDASDIPHAILALMEKCDCIVTYDAHFDDINTVIKINQPEELIWNYLPFHPFSGFMQDAPDNRWIAGASALL